MFISKFRLRFRLFNIFYTSDCDYSLYCVDLSSHLSQTPVTFIYPSTILTCHRLSLSCAVLLIQLYSPTLPHYHIAANVAATLYTSQTHQSRRIVTLTLVTLTQLAFSHLSPLPCSFCLSQCKGLRNSLDCHTAVASVTSQSHLLHCLRFLGFVVVHCTDQAIVSISSVFSKKNIYKGSFDLIKERVHTYLGEPCKHCGKDNHNTLH